MKITDIIAQDKDLSNFINKVPTVKNSLLTGTNSGALAILLLQVATQLNKPIILVEETESKAQSLAAQLAAIMPNMVKTFPVDDSIATQSAIASPDELGQRVSALNFLLANKPGYVITTAQGLQFKLAPRNQYLNATKVFKSGMQYNLTELNKWLIQTGYNKDSLVAKPGEFSLRGDILDIYPINQQEPVRIEFFGDEVDTIKQFDATNQRSTQSLESVEIPAASDRIFTLNNVENAYKNLQADIANAPAKKDDVLNHFQITLDELKNGNVPENYSFLVDYLLPESASLLKYLSKDGVVIFDDWPLIKKLADEVDQQNQAFFDDELKLGAMLPHQVLRKDLEKVLKQDNHSRLYLATFQKGMGRLRFGQLLNWQTRMPDQFFSQMPMIKTELQGYAKAKQTVILQADNKTRASQMSQNFADFDIDAPIHQADEILEHHSQVVIGQFNTGFVLPNVDLVYLTERELFNQQVHKKRRIQTLENAQRLRNYNDLKPGDYVVHVNHGIGRFEGIKTLTVDGKKRDYITITYQHHDQLFVPADQLRLVQKYVGSEGHRPHVDKLGSSEWIKTKKRVQSKVEDIADELIDLYAKRESEKGFAYSKDNDLQKQFEDAFPYVETPDQLRTVNEIKENMEQARPMDRLVVGDVGFGKTEVALRAAFKAIQDGKQVAFLVPTTILAQQHFETIQDRFKDFPVNVAMLSRFQTHKETKEIIEKLKEGKIDLIVGTHRLLSKDVKFKDLGLLIIDEEQRFGVKHKERLKQLKANIDVLTLTATPIPRTLHMSMVGARDLSVMETPPTNRYPIQTYVMEQTPSVVREACLREMQRNGQVFYLHNKISDIDQTVEKLQKLIPQAKIEAIHGRMNENQMEDILYRFLNRQFDILVTTTIIETGIDMPNVNTLIVEDADHYGLSQLYQLRGRIGRSARLAYAYFLYQPNKVLTEVGEKRLNAIRDFTQLGSGFKIAMRDLSIRGAGNMLGKQQHGFIDSVGYDLYSQMLDDAIKKRRGKKQLVKSNSEVDVHLEAYIPDTYIKDQMQKIEIYKKIKAIENDDDAQNVENELLDRFGSYPEAVENLLTISKLKAAADLAQAILVSKKPRQVKVEFNNHASRELEGPNIFKALEHVSLKAKVSINQEKHLVVLLDVPADMKNRLLFMEIHDFLMMASEIVQR